jgi:hypothetical protein
MLDPIQYEFRFLQNTLGDPEPGAGAETSIFRLRLQPKVSAPCGSGSTTLVSDGPDISAPYLSTHTYCTPLLIPESLPALPAPCIIPGVYIFRIHWSWCPASREADSYPARILQSVSIHIKRFFHYNQPFKAKKSIEGNILIFLCIVKVRSL